MTISHIVLITLKDDTTPEQVETLITSAAALKETCIHPTTQKPYLLSVRVGKDNSVNGLQGGYTHGFVAEFANTEDRDYYCFKDPAHREFEAGPGSVLKSVLVVDFEDGVF